MGLGHLNYCKWWLIPERIIILSATGPGTGLNWNSQVTGSPELKRYGTRTFRVARLEPQKNLVIFKRKRFYIYGLTVSFISSPHKDTQVYIWSSLQWLFTILGTSLWNIRTSKIRGIRDKVWDKVPLSLTTVKTAKCRKMSYLTHDLFFGFKVLIDVSFMISVIHPFIWDLRHRMNFQIGHFWWKCHQEIAKKLGLKIQFLAENSYQDYDLIGLWV